MAKKDSIKENVNTAEDFARKIWLAGLGAYGKSYDEAKGRFEELNADASKIFEKLVNKGEKLEAEAKSMFKEKTSELKEKTSSFKEKADSTIKQRVAEVRDILGMNSSDADDKIDALTKKIDVLTKTVAKLSKK